MMRVKTISVNGLFGTFNHEIALHPRERVTIIHGPNGIGKTVILRMIDALAEGSTDVFEHTPFDEFSVTFEDNTRRTVKRRVVTKEDEGRPQVLLEFISVDSRGNAQIAPLSQALSDVPRAILDKIDRHVPSPLRRSRNGWIDDMGRQFTLAEVLERYPTARRALPKKYRGRHFPDAAADLDVFFVKTNRLGPDDPENRARTGFAAIQLQYDFVLPAEPLQQASVLRVEQYSRDVVQRIQSVLADYAKHSQESDRTFPERLVRFVRERQRTLAERAILSQIAELEAKRRRLITLGFLDSESGLRDLTEDDVRRAPEALTMYVRDVQEKLQVFDDMAHRIGTLMDIINARFRYKRLRIHRAHGFQVVSESNAAIQLDDLSSGEQHQLVLLYELLFRAQRKSLVLVDEPEISLHVAWQSRFLTDLIGVLQLTDAYAIVATHSPVIIGTRSDVAVELKGPAATAGVIADA